MSESFNRQAHWENVYRTKSLEEVSWYQPNPENSLEEIEKSELSKDASIIDIGGGDSFLVDHLLDRGYSNITVLDISEAAIMRAKERLGDRAQMVKWIVADVARYTFSEKYDLWHDRAAFHFLNSSGDISSYTEAIKNHVKNFGWVIIGTFSEDGPKKCSGIDIVQYNPEKLSSIFSNLTLKDSYFTDHNTPFNTVQNFVFCRFQNS